MKVIDVKAGIEGNDIFKMPLELESDYKNVARSQQCGLINFLDFPMMHKHISEDNKILAIT